MMMLPLLLGYSVLLAWPALAEVVDDFSNCNQFFYKGQAPTWFSHANMKKICQKYQDSYRFATLYNTGFRIPYWSAYTLSAVTCQKRPTRRSTWFIEPQLSSPTASANMMTAEASGLQVQQLKQSQAISIDYENTINDRGHLSPNFFQCNIGHDATFTLTNAVPMDPCFNRNRWYKVKRTLKDQLSAYCTAPGGTAYLVTGSVPSAEKKIPDPYLDKEGDRSREYSRVSVPSYIWTAVCCNNPYNETLTFSFAFLAENDAKSALHIISVQELEAVLRNYYNLPSSQSLQVFADYCSPESSRGKEVLNRMKNTVFQAFQERIVNNYTWLLPETFQVTSNMSVYQNSVRLFSLGFQNQQEWHSHREKIYSESNMTCVLSSINGSRMSRHQRSTESSRLKVCTVQEQKHIPGSPISAKGWRCVQKNCDHHGESYKWCYTSYNNDREYCCTGKCTVDPNSKTYKCPSGSIPSVPCSPQYSAVTVYGVPCRPDHPCALYGSSYYWCYTDNRNNWGYCCSPQHYCGTHGYSYNWCYVTGASGSSSYCTP